MNKRALMITAATAALLSGHASAASPCNSSTSTAGNCDITTEIQAPIYTGPAPASGVTNAQGNLGNITIDTNGSVVIGTNPPTAPAVTLNSNSTITNSTNITYQGINSAVGVLLEEASVPTAASGAGSTGNPENFTGEFYNSTGTVDLLGAGSGKNGILIAGAAFPGSGVTNAGTGVYANTGLGAFTGVTGFQPAGGVAPVAIDLAAGSTLEVQGTNSFGINLIGPTFTSPVLPGPNVPSGGASLVGDIDVGGTIVLTPTTVGATATGEQNTAINIAGYLQPSTAPNQLNPALAAIGVNCACAMVGNLNILSTGNVSSEGQGAQGVVVQGAIQGAIINAGTLSTEGTTTPSTALNASDPEGSWALAVANNVTGGIFNGGPTASGPGAATSRATISMIGNRAAIAISPSANNEALAVQLPVTIGGFTDSAGFTYSLLNRGNIEAASEDANIGNEAIAIAGGSSTASVTLTNGIFNSGIIRSAAVTNADGPTTPVTVTATGIDIGNFVTIGNGLGGPSTPGTPFALVNSNETGSGSISASVSGGQTGTAIAIKIDAPSIGSTPGSLPSIFNSGIISASATTTNLLSTSIVAIGIEDESGTLTNIVNAGGTISAVATQLDNNAQIAVAIDVSNNLTTPVTVTDEATASSPASIVGDIHFGTMPATLIVNGVSPTNTAVVSGNIFFNNQNTTTNDVINIGTNASVTGEVTEAHNAAVDITIANTGALNLLTSLPTNLNSTVPITATPNVPLKVGKLMIGTGGNLNISLSQGNNINAFPANNVTVISASNVTINGDGIAPTLTLSFGGFVGTPSANGKGSQFVLISVPQGGMFAIDAQELTLLTNTYDSSVNPATNTKNGIPFLFTSNICTFNIAGATGNQVCTGTAPYNATNQEIVLTLTPKNPALPVSQGGLGLTGYALKMFPFVNEALVNDNTLGAAVVNDVTNQQQAQAAYASFAPDVSGATRATAISLTDSASNIVAARQRELRMYAGQEGDTTLWGQQFAQRLSQQNTDSLTGYNDSGYGFVFGADQGDQANGRWGAAFTFFTGGMSAKEPTSSKTSSEYYMLTGYTDWRGKGLFVDTQLSAGYADLKGRRFLVLTDSETGVVTSREADGHRPAEMLAGSVTTGGVFTAGGTVFMPQVDLDGLTEREEAYTESNGGEGFDLRVQPYYANSLRAFIGSDVREDINFGDFFLQPELRVGYRYDFVDGAQKVKASFASVNSLNGQAFNPFTITGPDPGRGNLVLGGGVAATTGSWSIGLSYDYLRAGSGPTEQSGVLTLVGRI